MLKDRELDQKLIIWTDEAHYWLNGYLNNNNYRFWGSENPHVTLSKPLHPQKVTVRATCNSSYLYEQLLKFFLYAIKE